MTSVCLLFSLAKRVIGSQACERGQHCHLPKESHHFVEQGRFRCISDFLYDLLLTLLDFVAY